MRRSNFGRRTIEGLTLGEFMRIWFEVNIDPWKDEYSDEDLLKQAKQEIKLWFNDIELNKVWSPGFKERT